MALLWLTLKWYTILEDFFLLDSVRYRDDVMGVLKSDWSSLKILISGWYRKYWHRNVFIYSISAMSWQYLERCHFDIVLMSEFPLWSFPAAFTWSLSLVEKTYQIVIIFQVIHKEARQLSKSLSCSSWWSFDRFNTNQIRKTPKRFKVEASIDNNNQRCIQNTVKFLRWSFLQK